MLTGSDKTGSLRELFSDRRLGTMLGLGFSSGIPFLLVYITQSAWLSEAKVPISILGLMSELTLAYKSGRVLVLKETEENSTRDEKCA